jgi:hypothetical protein
MQGCEPVINQSNGLFRIQKSGHKARKVERAKQEVKQEIAEDLDPRVMSVPIREDSEPDPGGEDSVRGKRKCWKLVS